MPYFTFITHISVEMIKLPVLELRIVVAGEICDL